MIHRCATCPFWDNDETPRRDAKLCRAPRSDKRIVAELFDDTEYYWMLADVYTTADFGCVIHPMNKAIL